MTNHHHRSPSCLLRATARCSSWPGRHCCCRSLPVENCKHPQALPLATLGGPFCTEDQSICASPHIQARGSRRTTSHELHAKLRLVASISAQTAARGVCCNPGRSRASALAQKDTKQQHSAWIGLYAGSPDAPDMEEEKDVVASTWPLLSITGRSLQDIQRGRTTFATPAYILLTSRSFCRQPDAPDMEGVNEVIAGTWPLPISHHLNDSPARQSNKSGHCKQIGRHASSRTLPMEGEKDVIASTWPLLHIAGRSLQAGSVSGLLSLHLHRYCTLKVIM